VIRKIVRSKNLIQNLQVWHENNADIKRKC